MHSLRQASGGCDRRDVLRTEGGVKRPTGLIAIVDHERGHRVYVRGRRLHHGASGALAVALGLLAMWQDRADARDWFTFAREVMR